MHFALYSVCVLTRHCCSIFNFIFRLIMQQHQVFHTCCNAYFVCWPFFDSHLILNVFPLQFLAVQQSEIIHVFICVHICTCTLFLIFEVTFSCKRFNPALFFTSSVMLQNMSSLSQDLAYANFRSINCSPSFQLIPDYFAPPLHSS